MQPNATYLASYAQYTCKATELLQRHRKKVVIYGAAVIEKEKE